MIYLMPSSVKVAEEGINKRAQEIGHPITDMARAMSTQDDTFWRLPEEKLREWLPVFELTDPRPVQLTGFADVVNPIWNALPTTLPKRDVGVVVEELKVMREQSTAKSAPIGDRPDALDRRAGVGHKREPEIEVVPVEASVEAE